MKELNNLNPNEYSIEGTHLNAVFSMEPGAQYGDVNDAFAIEADLPNIKGGIICFESFEQLEEFSEHLSHYVEECRRRRK